MSDSLTDTIAALATPAGESGIGIIRLSGRDALSIAEKIFVSKDAAAPSDFDSYTIHYGWIVKSKRHKIKNLKLRPPPDFIDEVILTIMRSPRSYTKEDVVEINCHGGIIALRKILDLVLSQGSRLAQPGEFTRRAFLNGRIDLTQAEAVLDIVKAKSELALKIGLRQLSGGLSARVNKIRDKLLDILSLIEANIDFPQAGLDSVDYRKVKQELAQVKEEFRVILKTSEQGRVLREGINLVICGRPNVGKSSLLNALLRQERCIVTPIAGTTRDTVEEVIDIKGIPVKIVDTAGIIEPRDIIEKKAVQRSRQFIETADLVILIFDGSKKISRSDRLLIKRLKDLPVLAVINKIDLRQKIDKKYLSRTFKEITTISCLKNANINLLEERIVDFIWKGRISSTEAVFASNLRHIVLLKEGLRYIEAALDSSKENLSLEFVAQDIKQALTSLDEISGRGLGEDLLDNIFSHFCIGK